MQRVKDLLLGADVFRLSYTYVYFWEGGVLDPHPTKQEVNFRQFLASKEFVFDSLK